MTYQEALDWIHGQLKFGIKPGLERMAWMLKDWEIHKIISRLCISWEQTAKGLQSMPYKLFLPRRVMRLEPLPHPILLTSRNESLLMVR